MIPFVNFLCVLLTYLIDREFLLDVHMNLMQFMCNERNIVFVMLKQQMKYTLSRTKIIQRHFCLSFSLLYLFIRSCKFVITETRAFDIAHVENAMSSLIIQSICYVESSHQCSITEAILLKFCSAHRKIPVLESIFSKEF